MGRKKTFKKLIITCASILSIALCVVVIVLVRHIAAPAKASVIITQSPALVNKPSFNLTPVPVTDSYVTFAYPAAMHPLSTQAPAGEIVAAYTFGLASVPSWLLAITINELPSPTLTDDSSYNLRSQNPSRYQSSTITTDNNKFTVMTDTQADQYAKVAFVLHDNMSADISLIGNGVSGNNNLNATFLSVLRSWKWNF